MVVPDSGEGISVQPLSFQSPWLPVIVLTSILPGQQSISVRIRKDLVVFRVAKRDAGGVLSVVM